MSNEALLDMYDHGFHPVLQRLAQWDTSTAKLQLKDGATFTLPGAVDEMLEALREVRAAGVPHRAAFKSASRPCHAYQPGIGEQAVFRHPSCELQLRTCMCMRVKHARASRAGPADGKMRTKVPRASAHALHSCVCRAHPPR